ncbi:Mo-dependent nitrogenase C-terminal domain-containing protein [Egbenema bharatensis]|uniref:Mo-dependent nitrogenase C-terminal domain-containing protein n=1 Tax=Egbenema bharatensis TaxID=3463334 RepID=UPI003A8829F5
MALQPACIVNYPKSCSRWHLSTLLHPIRQRLESIEISNPRTARSLCRIIPARCPFERQIKLFDYTLIRIPPLCKLNPFYDQVVSLRFKSLVFLADQCGEDVSLYY